MQAQENERGNNGNDITADFGRTINDAAVPGAGVRQLQKARCNLEVKSAHERWKMALRASPMDALKGHCNGTIPGCQKRDEPTHTEKVMELLGRFVGPKLSKCACMPGMWSVHVIMAAAMTGINSRG